MNRLVAAALLCVMFLFFDGTTFARRDGSPPDGERMERLRSGEILVEPAGSGCRMDRGVGLVRAPWERLWMGLTDHEVFFRIFPENEGAVVREQGEGYDEICFQLRVFLVKYDYCLRRVLDQDARRISYHMVDGDFEEMEGMWELVPVDGGEATIVSFGNRVRFGSWVPESWAARANRNRLPDTVMALRYWGETGRFRTED